jgi:hypothetical protein
MLIRKHSNFSGFSGTYIHTYIRTSIIYTPGSDVTRHTFVTIILSLVMHLDTYYIAMYGTATPKLTTGYDAIHTYIYS